MISFGLETAENKNQIGIWLPWAIQEHYQLRIPFICQISYLVICVSPQTVKVEGRIQAVGSDLRM